MYRIALLPVHSVFALLASLVSFALPAGAAADARVSESYGKLPLQFEANRGQAHKDVRFLSRGPGYDLYLTPSEAVLVLTKSSPDTKRHVRSAQARPDGRVQANPAVLRMSLVGATRKPLVSGRHELPGKANYFIGKDPAGWRTNVPTYAKVRYQNVYPSVDLIYYGSQRQLEYDFVVAPGANPKKIVLGFTGAEKLEIDTEGNLVLHAAQGDIRQHKPIIYQVIDGVRTEVEGGYVLKGAKRVGFELAAYDRSRPLVIDPVLSYSTYLGGAGFDDGYAIAVDAAGSAYVAGSTTSANFPTTSGAAQARGMFFVTKLNPTGSALIYSTYLAGGNPFACVAPDIAVDPDGNAYVTGCVSAPDGFGQDFPTTAGAFQTMSGGGVDAFVTKLNPTGSALVYSSYLGGESDDSGHGIAVDAAGNAYVTGWTRSNAFPTTPDAFQTVGGDGYHSSVAFVTKVNPSGSALVYSTYLDRSGFGSGIAVDADGNAYVIGSAAWRAFVTKLNPAGTGLVYSTQLGSSGYTEGHGIAVDADGNAYVTGLTESMDFPTTPDAFQRSWAGNLADCCNSPGCASPLLCLPDAFLTKLNPSGTGLVYSTYLGGRGDDRGNRIAVDAAGNAYVSGATHSTNFPTTGDALRSTLAGFADAFVTKLNPTGSALAYSTYLGGSDNSSCCGDGDSGEGIAVDASGNAYVTGSANSTDFPTTPGAFQASYGGGGTDTFITKIATNANRSEEDAASQIGFWMTFGAETGTFSSGTMVASNVIASTAMFSFTGTAVNWIGVKCNVCGVAAVSIDDDAPTVVNTAGPGSPGSLTSEVVFSASGLDPAVTHTMAITVTGTTTSGDAYIAVDAFDVTAGSAAPALLPPVVLPPLPPIVPPVPSLF